MVNSKNLADGSELRKAADKLRAKSIITKQNYEDIKKALDEFLSDLNREQHKIVKITCAGIYNSGKSSVLNALTGGEHFKVGDIPTTSTIDEYEYDGYIFVDTPGLNANNFDNETAQKAFKDADVLLFISNMQSGGLNAAEADYLRDLSDILGGIENLKKQTIFAMSNLHQIPGDSVTAITTEHAKNIETALGFKPDKILTYDAVTYKDGIKKGEKELIVASGLDNLKSEIVTVANSVSEISDEINKTRYFAKETALESAINNIISPLENKIAKLSEQAKAKAIDECSLRTAIKKCREIVTKRKDSITPPYVTDIYTHTIAGFELYRGDEFVMNVSSKYSCQNQAMSILNSAYNNRESQLNEKANSFAKRVNGVFNNSAEYRNDKIKFTTDTIIECNNVLKEAGIVIPTSFLKPIDTPLQVKQINISDVIREFKDDVIQYGKYYSVKDYFSMYCDINEQEFFDHTNLFGKDVYEYKYNCSCSDAIRNMADDMNKTIKSNAQSIIATVNASFNPFCSKLRSELDSRLNAMISEAESIAKSAGGDINSEIQSLQAAVDSVKKYLN